MNSPFKFLDAYELKDRATFFGRETEIGDLYQLVTQNRLTFVYGPSGIGKTSLVQCGLASRFDRVDWLPIFVRRGDDINASLRREIGKALGQSTPYDGDLNAAVDTLYKNYLRPVYLIFDQFEELFILGRDDDEEQERLPFYESIADLLDANLPCRILFIMREDYFGHLNQFEQIIPELYHRKIRVEPMSRDNLQAVITGSCQVFHIGFDDPQRSPQLIMDNILAGKKGIHMPYVQVYLHILYQEATKSLKFAPSPRGKFEEVKGLQFTDAVIRKVGPIADVLGRFLQEQKTLIFKNVQQNPAFAGIPEDAVSQVLDVFVSSEGTKVPVAYTVHADGTLTLEPKAAKPLATLLSQHGESAATGAALVSATLLELEKSRILRRSDDTLELAHDTLAALIDQQRSAELRQLRDIRQRIEAGWREHVDSLKSERIHYFDKNRIIRIEPFLPKLALDPEQEDFLDKSRREAERLDSIEEARIAREKADAQRRQKRALYTSVVAAVLVLAAVGASVFALIKTNLAEQAAKRAVIALLDAARKDILQLHYDAAFSKMKDAAGLGSVKDSVAFELMEIAFFRYHTGQTTQATEPFSLAAKLLGKPGISQKSDLGDASATLDKGRDSLLRARYFPVMVEVKGGTYQMQDEYETTVPDFRMAQTETTVWQYNLFCQANGHDITQRIGPDGKTLEEGKYQPSWGWIGNNPAVYVNWYNAAEYANWLSRKMNSAIAYDIKPEEEASQNTSDNDDFQWTVTLRENAQGYRLPTEAEWEYAAKGGARRDTFEYSGSDEIDEVAWYVTNSDSRTQAVRSQKANGAGLCDMSGNVFEWCFDWYGDLPAETPSPKSGSDRVLRGGSWFNNPVFCRVAYRIRLNPDFRYYDVGFRLVSLP